MKKPATNSGPLLITLVGAQGAQNRPEHVLYCIQRLRDHFDRPGIHDGEGQHVGQDTHLESPMGSVWPSEHDAKSHTIIFAPVPPTACTIRL
jgi:hypothetical protein